MKKKTIISILTLIMVGSISACGAIKGEHVENDVQTKNEKVSSADVNDKKENSLSGDNVEKNVEKELITRDQAIGIALKKADLARNEVYDLEAELDREREGSIWEVDFETKEYEYSYEINAQTKEIILEHVTPQDDIVNKPNNDTTPPPQKEEVVTQTQKEEVTSPSVETVDPPANKDEKNTQTETITRDRAIEIALNKAGLTKDAVYELEAELDNEREGKFWEVDFETREYEYSYKIDAQTSVVIHQEKERND